MTLSNTVFGELERGEIRACTLDDVPAVAGLFQSAFRNPRAAVPPSLRACLQELFFEHPWHEPDLPSLVYVTPRGLLRGFIGVLPLRMKFVGQPIRAAVSSSIVVDQPEIRPLAGARLLRSFLSGPQDISISEPLNAVSQGMWERLGGQMVVSESMEWLRVFRPTGLGLALASERLAQLFRPLGSAADRLANRVVGGALRPAVHNPIETSDADVSDEVLLEHIPEFTADYALQPDWDPDCIRWMLAHAARNTGRGTLYRRIVYSRERIPLGCYLYHGRPNKVAWVMNVLARPQAVNTVLDSLFAHAYQLGSVAIKGRTQARLLDGLLRRNCFFFRRHSAAVHEPVPQICTGR